MRSRIIFRALRPALAAILCLLLGLAPAHAHVPVPDSVLAPRTAPEAWNVLRLATANVERLLHENRLGEINDQLSLCTPSLRALPKLATPAHQSAVAEQAVRGSVAVGSLAQASMAGDRPTAESAFASVRAILEKMSANFDPQTVHADIFFCPMHPDFLSPDRTTPCALCGMALVPRRIPYSFVYVPPGEPSLLLTAAPARPLAAGQPTHVTIRLRKRDGSPVLPSELMVTHTRPIHLLIVDSALEDYHHEHPVPDLPPGEWSFSFTPALDSSYRVFADVTPAATGIQEYPFTDLPGAGPARPVAHKENTVLATVAGLAFRLSLDDVDQQPLRAREPRSLHVTIRQPDGQPFTRLEPVMAAFAHLVGFYDDDRTVVHLHPAGGEITDPALRGGPSLDFKFYPPKPGFLRLYVQVQIDGQAVFAPFNLNVEP